MSLLRNTNVRRNRSLQIESLEHREMLDAVGLQQPEYNPPVALAAGGLGDSNPLDTIDTLDNTLQNVTATWEKGNIVISFDDSADYSGKYTYVVYWYTENHTPTQVIYAQGYGNYVALESDDAITIGKEYLVSVNRIYDTSVKVDDIPVTALPTSQYSVPTNLTVSWGQDGKPITVSFDVSTNNIVGLTQYQCYFSGEVSGGVYSVTSTADNTVNGKLTYDLAGKIGITGKEIFAVKALASDGRMGSATSESISLEASTPVDLSDKFTLAVVEKSFVTGQAIKLQLTCNDLASIAGQYAILNIESLQVQQILDDGSIFSDTITKAQLDEGGKFPTVIDLKGTFANGILWESDYYRCKDPGTLEFTLNGTLSESGVGGSGGLGETGNHPGPSGMSIAPPVAANGGNAPVAMEQKGMATFKTTTSKSVTVFNTDHFRPSVTYTNDSNSITFTLKGDYYGGGSYSKYRIEYWPGLGWFGSVKHSGAVDIPNKILGDVQSVDITISTLNFEYPGNTYRFRVQGLSIGASPSWKDLGDRIKLPTEELKALPPAYPLTSAFAVASAAETSPVAVTNEQVVKTGEAELANALQIAATVEVPESGVYHVRGFLFGQDGETVVASISKDSLSLNAGSANALTFDFDGKDIFRSGIDGPYIFGIEVWVEDESAVMSDYALYTTAGYDHAAFEGTAATLTGTYSDTGVDSDSDGKFDKLTVNVGVNAIRDGNYNVTVYLKDENGDFAGYGSTTAALTSGLCDVAVNFNTLLLTGGGKWVVDWIQISDADSGDVFDVLNDTYTTKAYAAAQFTNPGAVFTVGNSVKKQENLVFTLPVAVTTAGDYTLSATLYDGSGKVIRQVEKTYNLTAGSTALTYEVLAADIVAGKFNGHYTLSVIVLHNADGDIVSSTAPVVSDAYSWQDFDNITDPPVIPPKPAVPAAPTKFVATATTETTVTLSWTKVDNADSYALKIRGGAFGNSFVDVPAANITFGANGTTATITGLVAGTTYYCQVAAVNAGGDSEVAKTNVTTKSSDESKQQPPNNVKVEITKGKETKSATITWTAPEGVTNKTVYVIQYKIAGSNGRWKKVTVKQTNKAGLTKDLKLKAGEKYEFQIFVKGVRRGPTDSNPIVAGELQVWKVIPTASLATFKSGVTQNTITLQVKNYLSATHSIGKSGKDVEVDTLTVNYGSRAVTLKYDGKDWRAYDVVKKEWIADDLHVVFKDGKIEINGLSPKTKCKVTVLFSNEKAGSEATAVKATSKTVSTLKS